MKQGSTFLGNVAPVSGHFLVDGCADPQAKAQIDTLPSCGTCLEGQMETTVQTVHAAEKNAAQARETMGRMYRSGLRK